MKSLVSSALALIVIAQPVAGATQPPGPLDVTRSFVQKIAPVITSSKMPSTEEWRRQTAQLESEIATGLVINFARASDDGLFPDYILSLRELTTPTERREVIALVLSYMSQLGLLGGEFGNTAWTPGPDVLRRYPNARWINWSACSDGLRIVICGQRYNAFPTPPPGVAANFIVRNGKVEELTFFFRDKSWGKRVVELKEALQRQPKLGR